MFKIFKHKKELELLKKDYERSETTVSILRDRFAEQSEENAELNRQINEQKEEITELLKHISSVCLINSCLTEVITSAQKKKVGKLLKSKETKTKKRGRKPRKAKEVKVAKPRGRRKNAKTK